MYYILYAAYTYGSKIIKQLPLVLKFGSYVTVTLQCHVTIMGNLMTFVKHFTIVCI